MIWAYSLVLNDHLHIIFCELPVQVFVHFKNQIAYLVVNLFINNIIQAFYQIHVLQIVLPYLWFVCSLSFDRQKILIIMKSNLSVIFLLWLVLFVSCIKNLYLTEGDKEFLLYFLLLIEAICYWCFSDRVLIHLKLFFIGVFEVTLCHKDIQYFQHCLLKRFGTSKSSKLP